MKKVVKSYTCGTCGTDCVPHDMYKGTRYPYRSLYDEYTYYTLVFLCLFIPPEHTPHVNTLDHFCLHSIQFYDTQQIHASAQHLFRRFQQNQSFLLVAAVCNRAFFVKPMKCFCNHV